MSKYCLSSGSSASETSKLCRPCWKIYSTTWMSEKFLVSSYCSFRLGKFVYLQKYLRYMYFRFGRLHLEIRCRSMSDNVGQETVWWKNIQKMLTFKVISLTVSHKECLTFSPVYTSLSMQPRERLAIYHCSLLNVCIWLQNKSALDSLSIKR